MTQRRTTTLFAALVATLAAACGDETVEPTYPATVTVSPGSATLQSLDETVQLAATVTNQHGQVMRDVAVTWTSVDPATASVDGTGLVTAAANGTATITATAGSASGTAAITVEQVPVGVTIVPESVDFGAIGDTARVEATFVDANGHAIAEAGATWESADPAVATVDASGLVTAVANGSATIAATMGELSGTAVVTVGQRPTEVRVSPAADTLLAFGDTLRLTAEALDANGHAVADAVFEWTSGDTLVVTVDATGLATGVSPGEAVVTATASGVAGRARLSVQERTPTEVAVAPDTVGMSALSDTVRLRAEVRDQTGRVMEGVRVSWSSGDTLVATVDSAGLATATGNGSVVVTAAAGGASGNATVSVEQVPMRVVVLPAEGAVGLGDTLRLSAEAFDGNGHVVAGAEFAWSSGEVAVAAVDESGLVTGVTVGTATITAAAGGAEGSAEIRVENPDRAALVALYNATDGPNWVDNTNWLTDLPLGEWYGVQTDRSGRVVGVDLSGRWDSERQEYVVHGLSGPIPPELGNLSNLQRLYLYNNALSGPIPPELGNLSNLGWLNLGYNALSGPIPAELGGLENLRELRLAMNELSGAIPSELGRLSNLQVLDLSLNGLSYLSGFSGAIPPELGRLSDLERLELNNNDLSGAIPPELGELVKLRRMDLQQNLLSGAIPPELGQLKKLERLSLASNDLSGPIPPELGSLLDLRWLELGESGLSGPIPPELGHLEKLESLSLHYTHISGPIPPELGWLVNLNGLYISDTDLSGAIPPALLSLPWLQRLSWENSGLCAPGTSVFVDWLDGLGARWGPFCNAFDATVLTSFYELAAGDEWTESASWLTGPALEEWYGVETDSLGRVVALHLSDNGLLGGLPGALGVLRHLTALRIDGNGLGGRLPLSLTALDLETFHYDGTDLCEPADVRFRTWIQGIGSLRRTEVQCGLQTDRDVLVTLYNATDGPNWANNRNWVSRVTLTLWHGVEVDEEGRVVKLDLGYNELSGPIPPELSGLANLEFLGLGANDLSGAIPPELSGLANLEFLGLGANDLSGAIPPELGDLTNLTNIELHWNDLSGPIPPELGNLAKLETLFLRGNRLSGGMPEELGGLGNLTWMDLSQNQLSGGISPELGGLGNVWSLDLSENDLSGPVPSEFGGLYNLSQLELSHNRLTGAMPARLKKLELESLMASGTELCAPREPAFEEWLATIPRRRIALCGEPPAAYLVQAVQSRAHPVPLVAGEEALLRVFVTAASETDVGIPEVRARFYLDGSEEHVADIPRSATPIPTEIDEGDLSKSANAEIPGRIVRPGLEMVIQIDPDGTLDEALGVPKRIPETGRMALDVRKMPVFDITLIPFLWSADPDSLVLDAADGAAADPEGHSLLEQTRILLPVGDIDVAAHEPVVSMSNDLVDVLLQTQAIRVLEGGGGHYSGIISGPTARGFAGIAYVPGRSSVSVVSRLSGRYQSAMAHELGHNMSLGHAPCGNVRGWDWSFPDRRGRIADWGYNFWTGRVVTPGRPDVMSYCGPTWISGYHFTTALNHRLLDEGEPGTRTTSLLLWGGVDKAGTPFLNPAFIADAPPALPDSTGDYAVTGRDESGRELFSLSFTMPVALSEEEEASSFVFALPARQGWAEALASITLSGPDGTVILDGDTDRPMAILRDPFTGRVRGFLRDLPHETQAAVDAARRAVEPGLRVLFSRGIPDTSAWHRQR